MASSRRLDSKPRRLRKSLLVAAFGLGIALANSSHALAQDADDEDDKTFEQKIIDKVMKGLGAQSMENSGIDFRERSPLVIPPTNNLPAPESAARTADAPNWPKDPDIAKRKQAAADAKSSRGARRNKLNDELPLTRSELDKGRVNMPTRTTSRNDTATPGGDPANPLSPSQLGYKGNLFSNLWGNGGKTEEVPFTAEPPRSSLIQPPAGYQTPSSGYAYGLDPNTKSTVETRTAAEERISRGAPN